VVRFRRSPVVRFHVLPFLCPLHRSRFKTRIFSSSSLLFSLDFIDPLVPLPARCRADAKKRFSGLDCLIERSVTPVPSLLLSPPPILFDRQTIMTSDKDSSDFFGAYLFCATPPRQQWPVRHGVPMVVLFVFPPSPAYKQTDWDEADQCTFTSQLKREITKSLFICYEVICINSFSSSSFPLPSLARRWLAGGPRSFPLLFFFQNKSVSPAPPSLIFPLLPFFCLCRSSFPL